MAYWHQLSSPVTDLLDPQTEEMKRYGQEVNLFKLGSMHAQVIVDKKGIIRYAHYGHPMRDIPANSELQALPDELNKEVST